MEKASAAGESGAGENIDPTVTSLVVTVTTPVVQPRLGLSLSRGLLSREGIQRNLVSFVARMTPAFRARGPFLLKPASCCSLTLVFSKPPSQTVVAASISEMVLRNCPRGSVAILQIRRPTSILPRQITPRLDCDFDRFLHQSRRDGELLSKMFRRHTFKFPRNCRTDLRFGNIANKRANR